MYQFNPTLPLQQQLAPLLPGARACRPQPDSKRSGVVITFSCLFGQVTTLIYYLHSQKLLRYVFWFREMHRRGIVVLRQKTFSSPFFLVRCRATCPSGLNAEMKSLNGTPPPHRSRFFCSRYVGSSLVPSQVPRRIKGSEGRVVP